MDRSCESDTLSFLTKKAQGQRSRTPGKVIHLKVIFTETAERWREIQPYQEQRMGDGWNKQTETSIKNKWKYLISPFTDWIYIAGVCCLVTSHCPAHFQMLIRSETINKSMAVGCQAWLFPGDKGESVVLLSRNVSLLGGSGPEPGRDSHLKHFSRVVQGRRFGFTSVRGLTI